MAEEQRRDEPAEVSRVHDNHHSDTVNLMGYEITVPGGIYTVVFAALGILTLIEVLIGSGDSSGLVVVLLAIAAAKAALVVLFYMHLRTDSRIFALVLLLPLAITLISVLYLLTTPASY